MPCTVLFVDDDVNLLAAMERTLRRENYRVRCATSADEALKIMAENPAELVVSDQDMPGMKGTELLARIRGAYPETVCFVLTGKATLGVAVDAINRGAVARFFTKPCDPTELALGIRQALRERELAVQARRLFRKVQEQNAMLEAIERQHPGLTHVERDAEGAILLEDAPADHEEFMRRIYELLEEPPPTM